MLSGSCFLSLGHLLAIIVAGTIIVISFAMCLQICASLWSCIVCSIKLFTTHSSSFTGLLVDAWDEASASGIFFPEFYCSKKSYCWVYISYCFAAFLVLLIIVLHKWFMISENLHVFSICVVMKLLQAINYCQHFFLSLCILSLTRNGFHM